MKRRQPTRAPAAPVVSKPSVVPTPGVRLRGEIEMALRSLRHASSEDRTVIRKVHDDLRGVLAHTAAVGETCQVFSAVNAVRAAERCLAASAPGQACAALTEALRCLPGEPA